MAKAKKAVKAKAVKPAPKKKPVKKVTAKKSAPVKLPVLPSTANKAESLTTSPSKKATQFDIVKEWYVKGEAWTKKFNLPAEAEYAQIVLLQKLRYGKISFNDL